MFDKKAYKKAWYKANKEKIKEKAKAWYEANKERKNAQTRAYYEANKEKHSNLMKAWYKKNKEEHAVRTKAWQQANKDKRNATDAKRRSAELNRTPSWLTKEDWAEIEDIYRMAKRRSEVEGIQYHVDHIIPLQGKNISGLHVPSNLQILRARDNLSKGNRYGER